MNVIGLMSGTSADGVDAALVDIRPGDDRPTVRLLAFETFPYPTGLRERLLATASAGSTADVCHLNAYLGELFADAAVGIARRAGLSMTGGGSDRLAWADDPPPAVAESTRGRIGCDPRSRSGPRP